MDTIAIIPARGGSKGVPNKNIHPLAGKPLINYMITAALNSKIIQRVIVSTDDSKIEQISLSMGAEVIQRPKELSGDNTKTEEAWIHVLETLKQQDQQIPKLLTCLQCTAPLTLAKDIDGTIQKLIEHQADSALSVFPSHSFLWTEDHKGEAVAINHDKRFRLMRQDLDPQYIENGAVYVMKVDGFLHTRHRFFGKTVMHIIPSERAIDIDDLEDFKIAEMILQERTKSFGLT
jgi:CMP-N-acetylneuraminic acid synthetase